MNTSLSKITMALILLFGLGAILVALLVMNDSIGLFGDSGASDPDSPAQPSSLATSDREFESSSLSDADSAPADLAPSSNMSETDRLEAIDPSFLTSFVKGSVEDESGRTLSGATIRVESSLPGLLRTILPGGNYQSSAESNKEGAFSIPLPADGAFRLSVSKDLYAPFFVNLVLPGDDLTITLETGAALDGEVLDEETGRPLAGVLVRARHGFEVIEARTNDAGGFRLANLPEGLLSLECFCETYDLERQDGIRLSRESENFVTVELRPGGEIEGRVMALGSREPLTGATVSYTMRTWGPEGREDLLSRETKTDDEGRFLFESISRRGYRLEAAAKGYTTAIPEPLGLTQGPEKLIEIYLKAESGASGKVFDPDGRPAVGARVIVLKGTKYGERTLESKTDGDGLFQIGGIEGGIPFTLIACGSGSAPGSLDQLMVAEGVILEDLEVRLQQPAAIHGVAFGPDGNTQPAARVTLDGIKGVLMRYNDAVPMAMTDSEGRFRFTGLAGGKYTLSAGKGSLRSDASEVFLQEGDDYETNLDLTDGLILRGEVFDIGGEPLDDVLVTAIDFTLEARNDPVRAKSKSSRRDGKPSPPRGKSLGQRIKRALDSNADRPIPFEYDIIRKLGYSRFRGSARTDETGAFCLSGLRPDDTLILSFKRHAYDSEVLTDVSPADQPVTAVLSPRVALMGQVIDYTTSAPVERFRVEWMPVENDFRSTDEIISARRGFRGPSRNFGSADGTFLIEDMEPGEVIMRVAAKGFRASEPRRFVMAPGYGVPFLSFALEKGGSIQGRIAAGNGSPVARVPVYLRKWVKEPPRKGKKKARVRTLSRNSDDNGRFVFTDIDAGVYEILVGDAHKPVVDPVRVKLAQGRNVSKAIILRTLGEVEIRVRGQSGVSCRAEVEIKGGPGKLSLRRVTGNLGIVSFPNLLAGKYSLKIKAKGYKSWSQALSVKEGKEFKKEIELQTNEK